MGKPFKMSPFFSILTACLNNGESLRKNLSSTQNQIFKDYEHIVVDGLSQDGTHEVFAAFSGSYDLRFVSEPDRGIADALNKGLKLAKGSYIVVIQADDALLNADTLERVFPLLALERYDIHSFPVIVDHPELGKFLRRPIPILWWNRFKFIFPHQGTFVHRRVFEKIGGFREDFSIAMDYDFFYRAILAGCSVKFYRDPLVSLMGGSGIGTRLDCVAMRLHEERRVQDVNERHPLWRIAQVLFSRLYFSYKRNLLPRSKPFGG